MSKSNNEITENLLEVEKKLQVISTFRDRYTFVFYNPGDLFEVDETIKSAKDTKRVEKTNTYRVSKERFKEISELKEVKKI